MTDAVTERKEVPAAEVAVGTRMFFPNSRGAQVVESIEESEGLRTFVAGTAKWTVNADHAVNILAEVEKEEGSDEHD